MAKLVTLKLGAGSLEKGFSVILQIGEDGQQPTVELAGNLPPALKLQHSYQRWQTAYQRLGMSYRLEAKDTGFATNVSNVEYCNDVAQELSTHFNCWLSQETFRPLRDKLLEQLAPQEPIRIILQTQLTVVQHLPWHTWSLCDRYPKAEIALSSPVYERIEQQPASREKIRILAILGHSQGIDTQTDQALLNQLPNAEVQFLIEPDRQCLNAYLWDPQGWDIFFFAGHSTTQAHSHTETTGHLYLNPTEPLTIPELKHALRKSLERGLKIALFNSCNGLGLAQALAELHIPQVLVMREPVPDKVAHEFLKSFLEAFARGESFYLAVREAREKLQGLEHRYPCATWLPIICQNPAELPPVWSTLQNSKAEPVSPLHEVYRPPNQRLPISWQAIAIASLISTVVTFGLRQIGVFQSWELRGFDYLIQLRQPELPDSRLLVITITEADVQAQDSEQRRGSLSDTALSTLLQTLEPMEPRVIGLDIYRDFSVSANRPQLTQQLEQTNTLMVTCKTSDAENNVPGIAPPSEVPSDRVGFSDFVTDPDGVVRRHLLALTPEPISPCQARYALSTLLALHYLAEEAIAITSNADGHLQVGSIVFKPLESNFGGYQGVEAGGHQIFLNYRHLLAPDQIADQVTLSDVLEGRLKAEFVRDRIILIGTTARSFGDYWLTPYSHGPVDDRKIAGVFMQAQMISQLLDIALEDRPLIQSWPNWAEFLWIWGWVLMGGCTLYGVRKWSNSKIHLIGLLGGSLAVELGLIGICWVILVNTGYWVPWVPSAIAVVLNVGSTVAYSRLCPLNLRKSNYSKLLTQENHEAT
ncbi:MAG: CHASE2 domain-containing protein [Cyanobacteria bacterium P01_F01_bin.86]